MNEYFFKNEYARVEEMFYMQQLGVTQEKIAKKFGVTKYRVRQLLVKRKRMLNLDVAPNEYYKNSNYLEILRQAKLIAEAQ